MTETRRGRIDALKLGEYIEPWISPVVFSELMPRPGWVRVKARYRVNVQGTVLDYEVTDRKVYTERV